MQPGSDRTFGAAVNNMLAIVIDPDAFGGREGFEAEAEAMLDYIAATAPAEGVDRVRLPGDPERESVEKRTAEGIPIDDNTWAQIREAATSVGLAALLRPRPSAGRASSATLAGASAWPLSTLCPPGDRSRSRRPTP
jgi:hypothetical protein